MPQVQEPAMALGAAQAASLAKASSGRLPCGLPPALPLRPTASASAASTGGIERKFAIRTAEMQQVLQEHRDSGFERLRIAQHAREFAQAQVKRLSTAC